MCCVGMRLTERATGHAYSYVCPIDVVFNCRIWTRSLWISLWMVCKYHLYTAFFSDFSRTSCTDGYLKLYLKGQEATDSYDKFDYEMCGNKSNPSHIVSDGPRLVMVFSSGELQAQGFKAKWVHTHVTRLFCIIQYAK